MRAFLGHPRQNQIHYILAFIAVVVIVVGVREIYTNVEKQNSNHKRSCLVASDRKKRGEDNIHDEIFSKFEEEAFMPGLSPPSPKYCYIFTVDDFLDDCINLGASVNENTHIYSKCVQLEEGGQREDNSCVVSGGWECDVAHVGDEFRELTVKESNKCNGQIDIFTTDEMKLGDTSSGLAQENLLQYILGGIVAGLLILTLIIYVTLKFVIPKLCPRNATTTRVIRNLGGTVIINERNSNLPGMADLPPEYGDIENYPKDDPLPSRPPRAGEFSNPAFTPDSHPEVCLPPPQYSEINR